MKGVFPYGLAPEQKTRADRNLLIKGEDDCGDGKLGNHCGALPPDTLGLSPWHLPSLIPNKILSVSQPLCHPYKELLLALTAPISE